MFQRIKNLWLWSAYSPEQWVAWTGWVKPTPDYGSLDKTKVVSLWDNIPSRPATVIQDNPILQSTDQENDKTN